MTEYEIEVSRVGFLCWVGRAYRGDELVAITKWPYLTAWGTRRDLHKYLYLRYGPPKRIKTKQSTYEVKEQA